MACAAPRFQALLIGLVIPCAVLTHCKESLRAKAKGLAATLQDSKWHSERCAGKIAVRCLDAIGKCSQALAEAVLRCVSGYWRAGAQACR